MPRDAAVTDGDVSVDPPISSEAYRALIEAEMALEQGQPLAAVPLLREATGEDPSSPYLHLRLAEALLEAGAPDEARRAAEHALALDPKHVAARRVVGACHLAAGDTEKARQAWEAALEHNPADRMASTMLAELHIDTGALDAAERVIEELMEREPAATDGYIALATILAERGIPDRALTFVDHALARDATHMHALGFKLNLLWALGRFEEALAVARTLAREQGDGPDVRRDVLAAHVLAGRADEARLLMRAWLEDDDSDEQRLLISAAWERAGGLSDAVHVLAPPVVVPGTHPPQVLSTRRHAELARLYLVARQGHDAATIACTQASGITTSPDLAMQLTGLCSHALVMQGRVRDAGQRIAQIAQAGVAPHLTAPFLQLIADVANAGGLTQDEARALLQQTRAREAPASADAEVLDAVAQVLESVNDNAQARAALDDALRARPSDSGLLFALARHLARMGEPHPAAELAERVMDRGHRGIAELNFAAFALAESGTRLDDARRYAWRALIKDPLSGSIVDTLGWCMLRAGDTSTSVEVLRRADLLSPNEGEILFHVATAQARSGDTPAAVATARRALTLLHGQQQLRARIEELLREIGGNVTDTRERNTLRQSTSGDAHIP